MLFKRSLDIPMNQFIKIIILIILIATPIYSEQTVILKKGGSIKGQITAQNEKGITIRKSDGSVETIEKSRILKVVYKDVTADEEKRIREEEERKLKAQEEAQRKKEELEEQKRLQEEAKKREEEERKAKEAYSNLLDRKEKARQKARLEGTRSEWDLVWRSAVLPSWGLFHGERTIAGSIYTGLFWGTLLFTYQTRNKALSAKADYDNSVLLYQVARPNPINFITASGVNITGYFTQDFILSNRVESSKNNYRRSINQYNASVGVLGLIYIIQIIHTYVSASEWVLEEFYDEDMKLSFYFNNYYDTLYSNNLELKNELGIVVRF